MNEFEKAVLEIYLWQYDDTNSFMNRLITCLQVADRGNRMRIGKGFPELLSMFMLWEMTSEQDEFFKNYLPREKAPKAYKD